MILEELLIAFNDVARLVDPVNWNDSYQALIGLSLYALPCCAAFVALEIAGEKLFALYKIYR